MSRSDSYRTIFKVQSNRVWNQNFRSKPTFPFRFHVEYDPLLNSSKEISGVWWPPWVPCTRAHLTNSFRNVQKRLIQNNFQSPVQSRLESEFSTKTHFSLPLSFPCLTSSPNVFLFLREGLLGTWNKKYHFSGSHCVVQRQCECLHVASEEATRTMDSLL